MVIVGGGLGRTPLIARRCAKFLPKDELLAYLEATLRVYNRYGRRDNIYKARIKILVHEVGVEKMREEVEAEFAEIRDSALKLAPETIEAIAIQFAPPRLPHRSAGRARGREAPARGSSLRALAQVQYCATPDGRLPHRDGAVAKARRRAAGRRECRPDGRRGRHRRRLWPGRHPCQPRAEPGVAACRDRGSAGGLIARSIGLVLPRPMSAKITDIIGLSPTRLLRAGQCALDPDRAAHLDAFLGAVAPARYRRSQDQDLGLHQRLWSPPWSATSASWASTATAWSNTS